MRRKIWLLTALLLLILPQKTILGQDSGPDSGDPNVAIDSPAGGEALQGLVRISGSANPDGFSAFELSFRFTGDDRGAWFLIAEGNSPVEEGELAEWDTFLITDGDYDLRLAVSQAGGGLLEATVEGLRVRNYSAVETSTPTPIPSPTASPTVDPTADFVPPTVTPTPTEAGSAPPPATLTPLPTNPAQISGGEISYSLARGAAGVLAAFILLGMYASIRNARRS